MKYLLTMKLHAEGGEQPLYAVGAESGHCDERLVSSPERGRSERRRYRRSTAIDGARLVLSRSVSKVHCYTW